MNVLPGIVVKPNNKLYYNKYPYRIVIHYGVFIYGSHSLLKLDYQEDYYSPLQSILGGSKPRNSEDYRTRLEYDSSHYFLKPEDALKFVEILGPKQAVKEVNFEIPSGYYVTHTPKQYKQRLKSINPKNYQYKISFKELTPYKNWLTKIQNGQVENYENELFVFNTGAMHSALDLYLKNKSDAISYKLQYHEIINSMYDFFEVI